MVDNLEDMFPENDKLRLFGVFHPSRCPAKKTGAKGKPLPDSDTYGQAEMGEFGKLFGTDKTDSEGSYNPYRREGLTCRVAIQGRFEG